MVMTRLSSDDSARMSSSPGQKASVRLSDASFRQESTARGMPRPSESRAATAAALEARLAGVPPLDAVRAGGALVAVSAASAPVPLRGTRVHNVWIRTDALGL